MRTHFGHRAATALLIGLGAVLVACAFSTTPHWADPGIHIVDGYWIPFEHPCDPTSEAPCVGSVRAAEACLDVDPGDVTGATTAPLPTEWVKADGQEVRVIVNSTEGRPQFVILDLVGGSQRAGGFDCRSAPRDGGPLNCGLDQMARFRVGRSPLD